MLQSSRPTRSFFLSLLSVVALLAGAIVALAPGADAASSQSDEAQERRERILNYWTPERVRNAIPKLPVLDGTPAHHRPDHSGGPSGGGGDDDGGGSTDVTGAPWNDASEPGMVGETTGKVLLTMDGTDYVCSGSTVTSPPGDSLVLTAGHCVHDGDDAPSSWATNWMFIPAYEDGGSFSSCENTTYGCWTAQQLTTTNAWYAGGEFADDTGFANMAPGGRTTTSTENLVDVVGNQNIAFTNPVLGATIFAFGYPVAKKYNGRDLIYCAGTAVDGVLTGTAGLDCDMTGGSSGGPWYASFDVGTATGTAVSVNSHGFRTIKDRMFGPVFDGDEQAAYELAAGTSTGGAKSDS